MSNEVRPASNCRGWGGLRIAVFSVLSLELASCAGPEKPLSNWQALPDSSFVSTLRAEVDADSTDLRAVQRLGVAEYRRGRLSSAASYLEQARRIDPQNPITLFFLTRTEDRRWNRELDRADRERTALAKGLGESLLPPGQVLVPDFWVQSSGGFEGGWNEGLYDHTAPRPEERFEKYLDDPSVDSLVRNRLSRLATLLADDALFEFAVHERERRFAAGLDSTWQSRDFIRASWGRAREVGALAVRAFDRESENEHEDENENENIQNDIRENGDRLLSATGASAILQGVLSFDGSNLAVQWIWIEPGSVTSVGPQTEAPVDSLAKLILALAEDLSRRPDLASKLWESFEDSGAIDLDFGRVEELVSSLGPDRDATRLERILARRSELERHLEQAEESYRRLRMLDPMDRSAARGIARIQKASSAMDAYETELWTSLEPPSATTPPPPPAPSLSSTERPDSTAAGASIPPAQLRSFLVDDVAASLCPGPLPDRVSNPVDAREDYLGSDPVEEWIPLGERVLEPGIGDFPDPPGRVSP